MKAVDTTNANTVRRDLNTLEAEVNDFTKSSSVKLLTCELFQEEHAGALYVSIMITYDQKPR